MNERTTITLLTLLQDLSGEKNESERKASL